MKLNFEKEFKTLEGKVEEGSTQGKALANLLAAADAKNDKALKHFDWALKLMKGEIIDLDTADKKYLREFIDGINYPSLYKAQLLSTLDDGGEPKKPGG